MIHILQLQTPPDSYQSSLVVINNNNINNYKLQQLYLLIRAFTESELIYIRFWRVAWQSTHS